MSSHSRFTPNAVRAAATLVAMMGVSAPRGVLVAQEAGPPGYAPLTWAVCLDSQIEVLVLGTFHFDQSQSVDVLDETRQAELAEVLERLERFDPDRIFVEFPFARRPELRQRFTAYLDGPEAPSSRNEIEQIGFRLARRLGHVEVYPADTPMNLWHDSIQVFDDSHPELRDSLRALWPMPELSARPEVEGTLREILVSHNEDDPPANSEMYAGFMPLVVDDLYVGAWKLRPWYDRNLRLVQNLFRMSNPTDQRLLLVIGSGHLRVLKQMMEMTPQLCPVSALPYLR